MPTRTIQDILAIANAGASIRQLFRGDISTPEKIDERKQNVFNDVRQQVLADVRKFGIQKSNLAYLAIREVPKILQEVPGVGTSGTDGLLFLTRNRTDSFSIPAVSFATSDIKRYGIGPVEKKPYLPIFSDMTIDIIADSFGDIHRFFYMWMNGISNFFELPNENAPFDQYGASSKHPFTMEYKDNYTTSLQIRTFSDSQEILCDVELMGAYPISIGEIQYNWNNQNELVRFPVTFTYVHWRYDYVSSKFGFNVFKQEQSKSNFDFVYNMLIQLYPAAQALQLATRRPQQVQDVLNIVNAGRTGLSPITRYF